MYMMVGINPDDFKDIEDDVDFCKKLLAEENCFTFPSTCFLSKNFFRVIICTSPDVLNEFGDRLEAFCKAHLKEETWDKDDVYDERNSHLMGNWCEDCRMWGCYRTCR